MTQTCPVCGNETEEYIPLNESFSLDTIGSLKFCTTTAGLYVHGRSVTKNSEQFDSFHSASKEL